MAVRTLVYSTLATASGVARLEFDYEDTSDPNDWTLVRGRVVNDMDRPVFVDIKRGNGVAWLTASVAAGQSREQNTGGPVRRQSDIPAIQLRTGDR